MCCFKRDNAADEIPLEAPHPLWLVTSAPFKNEATATVVAAVTTMFSRFTVSARVMRLLDGGLLRPGFSRILKRSFRDSFCGTFLLVKMARTPPLCTSTKTSVSWSLTSSTCRVSARVATGQSPTVMYVAGRSSQLIRQFFAFAYTCIAPF